MKALLHVLFCTFIYAACHTTPTKENVQSVDANAISEEPVIQDSLSSDQIKKLSWIQNVFAEVYPVSLEETITNFRRDEAPDKEIEIWLHMATAYQQFIANGRNINYQKKKDAFSLLLLRSMMPAEEAIHEMPPGTLSEEEMATILKDFNRQPIPLEIKK